jgi:large subunit ribosomal protein L21
MFAVLSHNQKQYKVEIGQEYKIDLINDLDGKTIIFKNIMVLSNGKSSTIGTPFIEGATVEGEIIRDIKVRKVSGVKFHAKKHYKRNLGHRQRYTLVKIKEINL